MKKAKLPYLEEHKDDIVLLEVIQTIVGNFREGGILYLCGNGGSFADAMHIKGELAKSFEISRPIQDDQVKECLQQSELGKELSGQLEAGLPVIVLGESHSLRSAYENDREPKFAFAQELNSFAGSIKKGVLLGISTSGNAENVIAAMTLANAYDLTTISFTGPDGGKLAKLADLAWHAPGDSTAEIQEHQVILYHRLCRIVEAEIFGGRNQNGTSQSDPQGE